MIYALGGVSGCGKTWLRSHHPALKHLRCLDIENVYRRAEAAGHHLDWQEALEQFMDALLEALLQDDGDVVLEAAFRPGGLQRAR